MSRECPNQDTKRKLREANFHEYEASYVDSLEEQFEYHDFFLLIDWVEILSPHAMVRTSKLESNGLIVHCAVAQLGSYNFQSIRDLDFFI